ncbi:heme/hemin ABC transporter substrate-binding protein [Yoonia sp. 2307UL14-13]|uniref:heme/hemin ABC transporter substrate-binding protein n=1 Tax=Yoonia sp. 2307UL14-13 TaxID=3126506 RepID=UPI003099D809
MIRITSFAAILVSLPVMSLAERYPSADAIVSVGGPITEIIYALGEEDRIIARDTTSVFPDEVSDLPDVGYMRRLSAEGVLSVGPDLIIARSTSGPVEALDQLRGAAVPIVFVEDGFTPDAVIASVGTVGEALGVEDKADALISQLRADFADLEQKRDASDTPIRVLFALSIDGGRLNASGSGTGADGIITLAGGVNVMADAFEGYKLVNDEAIITAAPDVIIMMDGRGDHGGRAEEVLALPAVSSTPAGENEAFITIPGAALGFGPRTPQLAGELLAQLETVANGE